MIKFGIKMQNVESFMLENFSLTTSDIVTDLFEGLQYEFVCNSPKNNYQFNSTLDDVMIESLLKAGYERLDTSQFSGEEGFIADFAFMINNQKVVFEVEKVNKEKILYDFLKFHAYINNGADSVILITPKNYTRPDMSTIRNVYEISCQRLEWCNKYGMCSKQFKDNLSIIGFHQTLNGEIIDNNIMRLLKSVAQKHFGSSV